MATETWAFVDEYGDPRLETEVAGVTKYFIVTVVLVGASDLDATRQRLEEIRERHFQTGEMKSQKLAGNVARWERLVNDLTVVPFRFYALAVDKREVNRTGGLGWKKSFYKNVCGRAYEKVMRAFPSLHVRADSYGGDAFRKSFARYIDETHRPDLFARGTFDFVEAKSDVLVQLADILSGLLARCYDPDRRLAAAAGLVGRLADKALLVDEWPPRHRFTPTHSELGTVGGVDERIAAYSLNQAERFVVEHENSSDDDVMCQSAVLERLLLEHRFGRRAHVSAAALLRTLEDRGLTAKGRRWFQTKVIAPIRDSGVVVAASPTGYCLPTSPDEVLDFAQHAEMNCVPLLNRVKATCDAILMATNGDVDILARDDLRLAKAMIEAIDRTGLRGMHQPPEVDASDID